LRRSQLTAAPTVSAITAPRAPSGFSWPTVESRAVWCRAPHDSAAREAFEEAGVVGTVSKRSVGSFPYEKRLKTGGVVVCEVRVFPLKVMRQSRRWPEREQRDFKWLSIKEAAETVQDPMLSKIIRRLGPCATSRFRQRCVCRNRQACLQGPLRSAQQSVP
jgi:hypothetical protein